MNRQNTRVLILGATGMLGSTLFRTFSMDPEIDCFGTIREASATRYFSPQIRDALIPNVHAEGETGLLSALSVSNPDVVINCIGIIKQMPHANDPLESLVINSTLPHRLAGYCTVIGARLIHFSTDCVFSGIKGQYREDCFPDACDLYGRTKYLGEVSYENSITLRTSIIGHEICRAKSLVDWFLNQKTEIKGFRKAVFSGLPTNEIARVVKVFVMPNTSLNGLYHLSVDPINKYDLLSLVAEVYGKNIKIIPDEQLVIDRSLNSDRFRGATGYKPRPWPDLLNDMYVDYLSTH